MTQFKTFFKTFFLVTIMLFASSCGKQPKLPKIPGVTGPLFNITNGKVVVTVGFTKFELPAGARIPIKGMEESYLEIGPNVEGGSLVQAYLDVDEVQNGDFTFADPHTLPGGRPLPGIIGGVLPSIAIYVPSLRDSTVYVSKQIFGFFLPIDMKINESIVTHRLNIDGKHLGNLSLVGRDEAGDNAGFLLLLNLKATRDKQFQQLIQTSKKKSNKNRIY